MALSPHLQSPSPVPQNVSPASNSQHPGKSDEQLPPSRRTETKESGAKNPKADGSISEKVGRSLKTPLLVGAAVLAAFLFSQMSGGETSHDNWINHEQAARHADADGNGIKWLAPGGPAIFTNSAALADSDLDTVTTQAFHAARQRRDQGQMEQVMQEAQPKLIDPDVADGLDVEPAVPTLSDGLADAVLQGDTKFFHIFLFDSCYEDGDVVDVKINGQRFATVQLTNGGVTLSVPMTSASTISIAGVYDGGGGITVACRTSQGEGFVRALYEGEEQVLAAVGQ